MNTTKAEYYAATSKDIDNVLASSSGGIFFELCKEIISEAGIVYGAAWENAVSVSHKRAQTLEETKGFRRSKYIKSKIKGTYEKVKTDLKAGKKVLFSGTPCQISGLYSYLGEDALLLYTVEVVCHGAPINMAWEKYVKEKSEYHNSPMRGVNFRDKRYGWKNTVFVETYENGDTDICYASQHLWHYVYVNGINMEAGCAQCKFASVPRVADISLADFWQYAGTFAKENQQGGISLVSVNSVKGKQLFENIKSRVDYEAVSQEIVSTSCYHLEHPPKEHRSRKVFQKMINLTTFEISAQICSKFGDVIDGAELLTMQELDADYVIQSFLEDNQNIIYLLDKKDSLKGIVTFGDFLQKYKNGDEWVNYDFQKVCIDDASCIEKINSIFSNNNKINRIPVLSQAGKLLFEVRRTSNSDGQDDPRRFLLPFVRIARERRKCYFYKRPSIVEDFPYSKSESHRINNHLTFPNMCENISGYKAEFCEILNERFSEDYIHNLMKIPPIIKIGRRYRHSDSQSELVNIIGGCRRVARCPENSRFTIHIYGRCGVFGYAVEDADTLPSQLQSLVKEKGIRVISHSTWGAEDIFIIQNLCEDLREGVIGNQDMILLYMNELPFMDELLELGIYFNDTTDSFHKEIKKRERSIDFYDIPGHMNAEGYAFIAEYIYKDLNIDFDAHLLKAEGEEHRKKASVGKVLDSEQEKEIESYIREIKKKLPSIDFNSKTVGAVVMNCDPFTKGHRYLIETALKSSDILLVFVVEEDMAHFSFQDRLAMVEKGCADLGNTYVLHSGKYIASAYSLTDYFFRGRQKQQIIDLTLDAEIFAEYIAPAFHITVRFVGEEKNDEVTNQYNQTLKEILPVYGIAVNEIERLNIGNEVISAKTVRELIKERNEDGLKKILPTTSIEYLRSRKML